MQESDLCVIEENGRELLEQGARISRTSSQVQEREDGEGLLVQPTHGKEQCSDVL